MLWNWQNITLESSSFISSFFSALLFQDNFSSLLAWYFSSINMGWCLTDNEDELQKEAMGENWLEDVF